MTLLTSKWMIAALVLVAGLVILYLIGRKSVHSEVMIPASPQEVWAVLTDFDKAKEWNTVLIPIEGELAEGASITYEFHQDEANVSQIPAKVKQMIPAKLLNQSGGLPGVVTFDHKYMLEAVVQETRLIIHEEYRGIYVPFWNPEPVEQAYSRLANALKDRVIQLKNAESE